MQQTPSPSSKELKNMKKRIILGSLALAVFAVSALPATTASAASPWWQVLTGSQPTNLWEPSDNVQEITIEPTTFGAAIRVEVAGETVGCIGAGFFGGFCETFTTFPAVETASQLEELLEGVFETSAVEVTGGPAGSQPFKVTVPGRSVPTIEVSAALSEVTGNAKNVVLSEGGSGRLILTATNLGDASVDATTTPLTIVDELPEGVEATGAQGFAGPKESNAGSVDCDVEAGDKVTCKFESILQPYDAIEVEIQVSLIEEPPVAGNPGTVTVSGANGPEAVASQAIKVTPEKVPFGIEYFSSHAEEEGGGPATQAGSHPFQLSTTIQLNSGPPVVPGATRRLRVLEQPALPRNFRFPLPAGLVGNTRGVAQCPMAVFLKVGEFHNACSDESAIGALSGTAIESNAFGVIRLAVPLFNLPPGLGEPARFGAILAGVPVVIRTAVDPDSQYQIIATVSNVPQIAELLSSTVVIWGTPGDPRHDNSRGWNCVYTVSSLGPCQRPSGLGERAFLRQPVSCVTPFDFTAEIEPWNTPIGSVVDKKESSSEEMEACSGVPFNPEIHASPTADGTGGSSGLNFQLEMPNSGLLKKEAIAEGQAKKVEVTLPEGMTINPSQAEGLGACSPDQFRQERFDSGPGEGCPESSKIGSVDITTPLLDEEAHGAVYVAKPYDNPFNSLLALYMVAKIPDRGVLVKQAGKVKLDPTTGQIVSTFDDLPQIPFESFKLHFFEGNRAPLVMPSRCGNYDIVAKFTPWNASDPNNPLPQEIITRSSSFTVDQGPNGEPCPTGTPPFKPGFIAGTESNSAGSYSPFTARLTRNDNEQEFTRFSIKLPKGVIGKLAGIPFCSDASIAAARARTGPNGGQEELEHPNCPEPSRIGRLSVGAGVGPSLTYAPGKIYLAGPYQGSKLSIVAITTAKVGPFDLGNVVIRQALKVNPDTAEVTTDGLSSDPIPHILQGIVVHARDIRIFVDRKDFVLNPTSCERKTAKASVAGSGAPVEVTSPFQAADCASLGFKPKLALSLRGGTKRGDTPRLKAVLKARKGDANIGAAVVTLPHSEFLEQAHIRTVCTRVQFNAGGGNGEQCPKASVYGHVNAVTPLLDEPLSGPVYLRSSSHRLPDLVAALHSAKVDINLDGRIDSVRNGRIRNTFEAVPDAPVTKFTLQMQGGKKGLLVNSQNICRGKHRAIATFIGQNGKRQETHPLVKASCGGKGKRHKR
ncbi:MAG TPA: hypothetical protein VFL77_07970 [Solirubrobacterales bacterium]|nr:hypothetical protein [Solirubrobacterales bacterium]